MTDFAPGIAEQVNHGSVGSSTFAGNGWYDPYAMHLLRTSLPPRRRLMWLLWLVLLLPIAQTTATLHVLSHALSGPAGEGAEADGTKAIQHAHCDLCLTAAALIGAAPPASPPQLPQSTAFRELPCAVSHVAWFAPSVTAYESRAPPFFQL